jgi:biopolymer transport protein ExbD
MSISFQRDDNDEDGGMISAINTTPLVDVMLVLLIIFLITIPVVMHTIPVSLPKEASQPAQSTPKDITVSVDPEGHIYWNLQMIADTAELMEKVRQVANQQPQPEIDIRGDQKAHYESVGRVVAVCQRAGIARIGFITEPPPKGD